MSATVRRLEPPNHLVRDLREVMEMMGRQFVPTRGSLPDQAISVSPDRADSSSAGSIETSDSVDPRQDIRHIREMSGIRPQTSTSS